MSEEHGQPLGGLPAHVRRSLLAVLVVAVAVASDACDASVGDAAALRAAVKRAGSDACVGRMNVVAVTADIALAAPVLIWANASVSLVGPHTISGAGDHGLLVNQGGWLALSGLRLTDGNATDGGCVSASGLSLAVSDVSFERCAAGRMGGAIYAVAQYLTLRSVTFSRTSAGGPTTKWKASGGAVFIGSRYPDPIFPRTLVVDCTFEETTAASPGIETMDSRGGAISVSMGEATIVASTFVGTRSSAAGGALSCEYANCSVSRSLFRSTSAGYEGGAVAFVGRAPVGGHPAAWSLAIEDTVFEGTVSNYSGGAVWVSGGVVAAVGVTFDRCVAAFGGAVHLESRKGYSIVPPIESDLDLRRCTFSSCRATAGDGGGVNVVSAGRVTLGPGLVFRGNVAETGGGGGAYLRNVSRALVVRDAVFAENRCRSRGGGLFVEFPAPKPRVECARCPVEMEGQPCAYAKNGTWRSWDVSSDVAVVGSTFVGNEANFSAGGLGVTGGARMALEDTSFHRNSARISVPRP
ncbi:hypothetical protein JL721_10352 [Aureococcus anophagefferens]|nr:hypothetical protein JL721_10352 [Aureococcus anophagefferens]